MGWSHTWPTTLLALSLDPRNCSSSICFNVNGIIIIDISRSIPLCSSWGWVIIVIIFEVACCLSFSLFDLSEEHLVDAKVIKLQQLWSLSLGFSAVEK
jgi:hypothetical protein